MSSRKHEFNLSLGDESWRILEKLKAETRWPKNKIIGRALGIYADRRILRREADEARKARIDDWLEEGTEQRR